MIKMPISFPFTTSHATASATATAAGTATATGTATGATTPSKTLRFAAENSEGSDESSANNNSINNNKNTNSNNKSSSSNSSKKYRGRRCSEEEEEILSLLTVGIGNSDKQTMLDSFKKLQYYCSCSSSSSSTGGNDAVRNRANIKFIVENDGVGIITQVIKMNLHPSQGDFKMLSEGIATLTKLMEGGYYFEGASDKIQFLGGDRAIITAMKTFPHDAKVQCQGCKFFGNFLRKTTNNNNLQQIDENNNKNTCNNASSSSNNNNNNNENSRMKMFVKWLGGISLIVSAMENHPSDAMVQYYGTLTLFLFCREKQYVSLVYEAGGLEVVVRALRKHGGGGGGGLGGGLGGSNAATTTTASSRYNKDIRTLAKEAIKTLHDYLQNYSD